MEAVDEAVTLKRKRARVGIAGFIVACIIAIPITLLLEGLFISMTTFFAGLAGSAWALLIAEKKRNLAAADDVKALERKKALNPLGINMRENGMSENRNR
jgi:hypothetical protein